MKAKNLFRTIAGGILSFLGFGSCGCDPTCPIDAPVAEYGVPHAEYKIMGTVKDSNGNPIPGIRISCEKLWADDTSSEEDGSFLYQGDGFPEKTVRLIFEDVDGDENGGLFKTKEVDVEPSQVKEGQGNWDQGTFEGSVDVTLEKQ